METFDTKDDNFMVNILDFYADTVDEASNRLYQDEEQPHIRLYESPEVDDIRLDIGAFPIIDEGNYIKNKSELMQYIQKLVKGEITSPKLELITGFKYIETQGKNLDKKPTENIVISAEWKQV